MMMALLTATMLLLLCSDPALAPWTLQVLPISSLYCNLVILAVTPEEFLLSILLRRFPVREYMEIVV